MPITAAVASRTPGPSSKDVKPQPSNPHPRTGRRMVRRRRGARADEIASDDEIERAAMSDESESDAESTLDSGSESERESDAESTAHHGGGHHPDTPSTTQSPPPGDLESAETLSGFHKEAEPEALDRSSAFPSAAMAWSDMVADEAAGGNAGLPVIDFKELQEQGISSLPTPAPNEGSGSSEQVADVDAGEDTTPGQLTAGHSRDGFATRGNFSGRGRGQSARQAYQQRLESDPSFVPIVGEFWGHDDRLIQKDYRSLSGWWRGRWQGRGRGRGGFVMGRGGYSTHVRGRGGFSGDSSSSHAQGHDSTSTDPQQFGEDTVPPVDKQWTHDGFEEMNARDDRRRQSEQERALRLSQKHPERSLSSSGFRGGFGAGRGLGMFARRGGFSPSPTTARGRHGVSFATSPVRSNPDRVWFAKKPECPWTKQHEGFLLKPRQGSGPEYRVRLPGKGGAAVRAPAATSTNASSVTAQARPPSRTSTTSNYVVHLPKPRAKASEEAAPPSNAAELQEPITTVEELPIEPPSAAPPAPVTATTPYSAATDGRADRAERPGFASPAIFVPKAQWNGLRNGLPAQPSEPLAPEQTAEVSPPHVVVDPAQISPSSMQTMDEERERAHVGQLPPLQTVFPPPTQPSPTYSSPYGFTAPLPPGIALNPQGYAYEVASGRPVFLHPTPPPPMPLYNPRPISQHGIPFIPGHVQHQSSMSGDFLLPPHTPPVNGFVDPTTGAPLFSLPRQSSRVEIRAPTDPADGKAKERKPSSLRSATSAEAPSAEQDGFAQPAEYFPAFGASNGTLYAPPEPAASGSSDDGQLPPLFGMDPNMMGYAAYQQPYYYPDQYGYPAYMEMPQQPGHYEQYIPDPNHPQAPVYY